MGETTEPAEKKSANPMLESLQSYRRPRRPAQWTMMLIGLIAAMALLSLVFRVHERSLLVRVAEGAFLFRDPGELEDSDQRIQMTALLSSLICIVAGIVFLRWVNLSYRNMLAFGAKDLRYGRSPNWAWIAFFIPILNLFRPAQIAQEIWEYTQPDPLGSSGQSDRIIALWWARVC